MGRKVRISVTGNSMLPWIAHDRDQVLLSDIRERSLKRGDIILFMNNSGNCVLHRICKKDVKGYHTIGDACLFEDGLVLFSEVMAVVDTIYRDDKVINCSSTFWRFLFRVWMFLLPIRKYLMGLYLFQARVKRRIRKSVA